MTTVSTKKSGDVAPDKGPQSKEVQQSVVDDINSVSGTKLSADALEEARSGTKEITEKELHAKMQEIVASNFKSSLEKHGDAIALQMNEGSGAHSKYFTHQITEYMKKFDSSEQLSLVDLEIAQRFVDAMDEVFGKKS